MEGRLSVLAMQLMAGGADQLEVENIYIIFDGSFKQSIEKIEHLPQYTLLLLRSLISHMYILYVYICMYIF